ncbi:conserved hypothetical protein [Cupriavidus metallidurans CH34]|uniref:Uncharacterized protein n=1 Tax=Cupriavidus metallidurans (strain ATCC 43123 / DSM 2839 / NBRC 102507 / CH34) TaxID=266264 RepID=Q1LLC9_CUPMC|nr:conserved hypothetical protein [Cupriavidus metallidurans CH34]
MLPEPANCRLCGSASERIRSSKLRGFRYTCPSCGSFGIESAALAGLGANASIQQDLAHLRAYGLLPLIHRDKQGVSVGPGRV